MGARRPDLAGTWYPASESECLKTFNEFEETSFPVPDDSEWNGGILPHAGWVYSGKVAYNVVKYLQTGQEPDTVVVFGRHLHRGSNNYIMSEGSWITPLGELAVASDIAEKLIENFDFTIETHSDYEPDNTIELQLPFIKYFFPDSRILTVGVPPRESSIEIGSRVSQIADDLGIKIKVLGSTDLTHYGPNYANTSMGTGREALDWVKNENDKRMVDLIVAMKPEEIIRESQLNFNACCGGAVAAAVAASKKMGSNNGKKLVYTTSYDVIPGNSFVGYTGVVFN
jgi:AmmeMemoRadiSam system protein B